MNKRSMCSSLPSYVNVENAISVTDPDTIARPDNDGDVSALWIERDPFLRRKVQVPN